MPVNNVFVCFQVKVNAITDDDSRFKELYRQTAILGEIGFDQ